MTNLTQGSTSPEISRSRLLALLREKSYRYREDPPFRLVSGRTSPHYVDCKPVMHSAEGKALIGEIVFDLIRNLKVEAVGGLTMGADPIAYATSLISFQKNTPIKSFSVRKTPKGHGTGKRLEGDLRRGDRVVVVEDVITSGGSVISAIQAAREEGLDIVQVIVLVDREEGGREAVEKLGVPLQVVFTLPELQAAQVSR